MSPKDSHESRSGVERRRHHRLDMVTTVKVYDMTHDRRSDGTIVNVSAGGLGILLEESLEEKSPIAVEFELPPRMVLRHLQAHVVRCHKMGKQFVVGIQFYRVPKQVEDDFDQFVGLQRRQKVAEEETP